MTGEGDAIQDIDVLNTTARETTTVTDVVTAALKLVCGQRVQRALDVGLD